MLIDSSRASAREDRYRVGAWEITPALNELRRGDETVRVEPKAIEVLVALSSRAGSVISRDDLLGAIWPGVVVGDDALTQAIIKLRRALGDTAREPEYIQTVSKRGYRLVAPVSLIEDSLDKGPTPLPHNEEAAGPVSVNRRSWWKASALSATAVGLLVGAVWLFTLQAPSRADTPVARALSVVKDTLPTIAVVPFEPFGSGNDLAYFARGLSSDLATDMSRLSGLRVITVSQLPGKDASPARYIVSGSVQRGADQLDVNVRLTEPMSGQQLWAERYRRRFGDLFAVQQEIIDRLIKALPVTVSEAEHRRAAKRYTRSLEAYDDFLRAKAAYLARTRADNEAARELYLEALQLDPAFARAYAGLALTYTADYRNQWAQDAPKALERATALAQTALRIDPEIPEVHSVLGYLNMVARRHEEAIRHLNRAIELDGSYADAYAFMGALYTHIGSPARAIPLLRAAMRLNPEAGFIYFVVLGRAYLFQGDSEQASINLRHALERNPADIEAHVFMAATLVALGDREDASWEAEEIRGLQANFSTAKWLANSPMTDEGQRTRLISWMATLGL
jgi:DNA-binding winged helix-turn-helix (wHTH) protein/TolB-like protein